MLKTKLPYITAIFIVISMNSYLSKVFTISPIHYCIVIAAIFFMLSLLTVNYNKNLMINKTSLPYFFTWGIFIFYSFMISLFNEKLTSWTMEIFGILIAYVLFIVTIKLPYSKKISLIKISILISTIFCLIEFLFLLSKFKLDFFYGYTNLKVMYEIKTSSILYTDTNFTAISALCTLILLNENKRILNKSNKKILNLLLIIILIFMYSRTALISLAVYLLLKKIGIMKFMILISSLIALSVLFALNEVQNLDGSLMTKFDLINNTIKYISTLNITDFLFGKGAESSITAFHIIGTDLGAHLLSIVIFVNYGIIGILLYSITILVISIKYRIYNFTIPLMILSFSMLPVGFPAYNIALSLLCLTKIKSCKKIIK